MKWDDSRSLALYEYLKNARRRSVGHIRTYEEIDSVDLYSGRGHMLSDNATCRCRKAAFNIVLFQQQNKMNTAGRWLLFEMTETAIL